MIVYRITKNKYSRDTSGIGAFLYGGRWNSIGKHALYTSENPSLCTLEALVHLQGNQPQRFSLVSFSLPNDSITPLASKLPEDWNQDLELTSYTVALGDQFLNTQSHLALKIPSIVVSNQFNYLINPLHPRIQELKILSIEPYSFDPRLL